MILPLARWSPDTLVLLALGGILLIHLEFNRPGSILFGAFGLLALLCSVAALARFRFFWVGVIFVFAGVAIQITGLRGRPNWFKTMFAGVCVFFGARYLVEPGPSEVHIMTALLAAILLGPGTSVLTAIAWRARVNKGLDS